MGAKALAALSAPGQGLSSSPSCLRSWGPSGEGTRLPEVLLGGSWQSQDSSQVRLSPRLNLQVKDEPRPLKALRSSGEDEGGQCRVQGGGPGAR